MNANISAVATPRKSRYHAIEKFRDRDDWLELLLQVKARELSGAAKLVGVAIALHLDPETMRCEQSREAIADFCGMDARSVRRMVAKLEAEGWLGVDRTLGYFANSFFLRTPDEPAAAPSINGGCAHV